MLQEHYHTVDGKSNEQNACQRAFPFGETVQASGDAVEGEMKPIEAGDAGIMMAFAQKVIIIPGYGMAVAQAQQKVWELSQLLIDRGVDVKFAIHPVAECPAT